MGKVWFTFGLFARGYDNARFVINGTVKSVYCAATLTFTYRRLNGSRSHTSPERENPFYPVSQPVAVSPA